MVVTSSLTSVLISFFAFTKQAQELVEIRLFKCRDGIARGGYCANTPESITALVESLDQQELLGESIFYSLNGIAEQFEHDEQYLGTVGSKKTGITNADIDCYEWIVVDIDPVRPTESQATETERQAARLVAENVQHFLEQEGIEVPLVIESGNGFNLYIKVDLPNTPENVTLVKGFLRELHNRFSTDTANIDTAVYNAARFFKVPGSVSAKGENTPERPYTVSSIIYQAENPSVTPRERLEAVVAFGTPDRPAGPSSGSTGKEDKGTELVRHALEKFELAANQNHVPFLIKKDTQTLVPISQGADQIRHMVWEDSKRVVNVTALQSATSTLESIARQGSPRKIETYTRSYSTDDTIYYDLDGQNTVCVTAQGIAYERPPAGVFFISHPNNLPQVKPDLSSPSSATRPLLNQVLNVSEDDTLDLLSVYIPCLFLQHVRKPLLALYGQKGATKSTTASLIGQIFHPRLAEKTIIPKKLDDVAVVLSDDILTIFDNMSDIKQDISDLFCTALDGAYYQKRALYTDSSVSVMKICSNIIITGLGEVIKKSDLVDRSLFIRLSRIPEQGRRTIQRVNQDFDAVRPQLLGSILNTLVGALNKIDQVPHDVPLPRMADFGRWGYAVAEELGIGGPHFLDLYRRNNSTALEESLSEEPIIRCLEHLLHERNPFVGTSSDLLAGLEQSSKRNGLLAPLPGSPSALSRKLHGMTPDLEAIGIKVQQTNKVYTVTDLRAASSPTSLASEDSFDDLDLKLEGDNGQ